MSWRWTRDGQTLTSTCQLCATTITGRRDTDVTLQQRSHDPLTCQRRRAETTRAIEAPAAAAKWASHDYQATRRNTARRRAETRCDTTVLSVLVESEQGKLMGHKAAPITSRGLTAKTIGES